MNPLAEIPEVKAPWLTVQIVNVTPALAADWLRANTKNRKLKPGSLRAYANDMRNAAWSLTHQGIAFGADGRLIDGQHRLMAVVESKATVPMLVSAGWPEGGKHKTMDAVDRGVGRSIADQLGLSHGMVNAREVVSICNAIVGNCTGLSKVFKSTTDMTLQVVGLYRDELNFVLAHPTKERGLKMATVTGCLAQCHALWPGKMPEVIARLHHGENLTRESSLLWLRNWLMGIGQGEDRDTIRRTCFYHLVEHIEGRKVKSLCVNSNAAHARVLRLQEPKVRKILALYNQLLPEFMRSEADERKVLSPIAAEGIAIGKSLRDPFTNLDLSARLDAGNNSGQWLMTWRNRGWIEPVSGNQFAKTGRFGL